MPKPAKIENIIFEYIIYMIFYFVFLFISNWFSGGKDRHYFYNNCLFLQIFFKNDFLQLTVKN